MNMYLMRDIPEVCRPRERLLKSGVKSLSDAELLAIVLGTGAPGKNVIQLARELLLDGGLKGLRRRDLNKLRKTCGIGPTKAARIAAVFELTHRITLEIPEKEPFDARRLGPKLVTGIGHYSQEHLGAVLLDARYRQVRQRELFIGTVNGSMVSPAEILRFALGDSASAVVLYHNHPSGDPTPSRDDIAMTERVRDSLQMLDMELVDHIVVSEHRYMSMKQAELF
ncbi:MAG TPA: DNA repair protein RadC [Thermoanaerobaculia bacterium]